MKWAWSFELEVHELPFILSRFLGPFKRVPGKKLEDFTGEYVAARPLHQVFRENRKKSRNFSLLPPVVECKKRVK